MAKVIQCMQVQIISDNGSSISRAMVSYEAASVDDASLRKSGFLEIELTGQALADLQTVFDSAKALAEAAEGIV